MGMVIPWEVFSYGEKTRKKRVLWKNINYEVIKMTKIIYAYVKKDTQEYKYIG